MLDFKESMKRMKEWEEKLTNIQTLVEPYLQNKDIIKARDVLFDETKKNGTNWDSIKFEELFKKYPPDNEECPICKGKTIGHSFNTRKFIWKPTHFCKPCSLKKYKEELYEKIDKKMSSIISRRYWNAKIDDFPGIYRNLHKKENGLFLYGARGVGKTHLMAAIAREIVLNTPPYLSKGCGSPDEYVMPPCKIAFISTPELLMQIRSCFNNKNTDGVTEEMLLNKYSDIEVLMLDDLGAEKPTEWVLQTMYLIIDRRYRNMKKTIVSSNYDLSQIAKRLDDRISSRIAGMCQIVKMTGKDKRL